MLCDGLGTSNPADEIDACQFFPVWRPSYQRYTLALNPYYLETVGRDEFAG